MSDTPYMTKAAWLYILAALMALGSALWMALGISLPDREPAVAYVNGQPIPKAEYSRAINAMQAGLERPLTDADHARALRLLIDEELIVQDAERLNLSAQDRLVRKNLVQAMIRSATSLQSDTTITAPEIQSFYRDNRSLFSTPETYSLHVAAPLTAANTDPFRTSLDAGATFEDAAIEAGYSVEKLPPDLPIGQVNSLLGGDVAALVPQMRQGDIAGPVTSNGKSIFLWLTQKTGGDVPLSAVQEQVETEIRRRRDEAALKTYITRLRSRARIKDLSNSE